MRFSYNFLRSLCVLGFRLFFRGRLFQVQRVPLTGGVLLVCNHQSFLDPMLATLALRRECHYMARDTLFKNPRFRRLIEWLNAFPVRRGSADITAIKETLRRLKAGGLVTVFPEGTRTIDGAVGAMQPGVVLLARKANVPLVPCLIDGAYQAWPRSARLPRPAPIRVAYGEPLLPSDIASLDDQACIDEVRRRIVALQTEYGRASSRPR